jgi:hypothetical protein
MDYPRNEGQIGGPATDRCLAGERKLHPANDLNSRLIMNKRNLSALITAAKYYHQSEIPLHK